MELGVWKGYWHAKRAITMSLRIGIGRMGLSLAIGGFCRECPVRYIRSALIKIGNRVHVRYLPHLQYHSIFLPNTNERPLSNRRTTVGYFQYRAKETARVQPCQEHIFGDRMARADGRIRSNDAIHPQLHAMSLGCTTGANDTVL